MPDYLGMFAVTGGIGAEELAKRVRGGSRRLQRDHREGAGRPPGRGVCDLAARAGARRLGPPGRGDAADEDLHREKHRGIRPAPGYPACPDHSEKFELFELLQAQKQGMALTESAAMTPAASVSGFYFSHPLAKYFNVGRIGQDQAESYAQRRGMTVEEVEKWLGPNLSYESRPNSASNAERVPSR